MCTCYQDYIRKPAVRTSNLTVDVQLMYKKGKKFCGTYPKQ